MSSRRVPARTLRRRFTLGSGPLKRTSDRVEFLSRVLLASALLLAVPLGLLAGAAAYTAGHLRAAEESADRHAGSATLLTDAELSDQAGTPKIPTSATWSGPDGAGHTGKVEAPPGASAGSTVDIWVDDEGELTEDPFTEGEAVDQGVVLGILASIGVLIAGMGSHLVVLWLLERRRFRRWESGWAAVEPLWVSRFR